MSAPDLAQFTFIVRHCGERTTEACAGLLAEFAPRNRIHRVSAQPFHETLRKSLELGLAEGRPWTLCIDADVLILPALAGFLAAADDLPAGTFEAQALVLDKLVPARRPAGNHLYRTELIARALPAIPLRDSLRPEYDMIRSMVARGHPARQTRHMVGLHDFEQAHRDLYLKAFLHAHKHRPFVPQLRSLWKALERDDDDFKVALRALEDAGARPGEPQLGRDYGLHRVEEALAALALAPKPPLGALAPAQVAALMQASDALRSGATRALHEEVQDRIDAAVFPSLAARGAAMLAGIAGRLPWRNSR